MKGKSGDDDTGVVRWSWRNAESGRDRSRRGWRSDDWGGWFCHTYDIWELGRGLNVQFVEPDTT